MAIQFEQAGNFVLVSKTPEGIITPSLPAKVYNMRKDEKSGALFLSAVADSFPMPEIFGDLKERTDVVMQTYEERAAKTTGVLLSGEKGSGKSLQMCALANACIAKGIPAIQISAAFGGTEFNEFIANLGACMLMFDEFDKVYEDAEDTDSPNQEALLSLTDGGAGSAPKLIVFTVNKVWAVSDFFINRPGRIYYHFSYKGVTEAIIREYCELKLSANNIALIEPIVAVSEMFDAFNFDMLMCLVEELNRFNCPLEDALSRLNMQPLNAGFYSGSDYYVCERAVGSDGKDLELRYPEETFDLTDRRVNLRVRPAPKSKKDQDSAWDDITIYHSHIVSTKKHRKEYAVNGNRFVFVPAPAGFSGKWTDLIQ